MRTSKTRSKRGHGFGRANIGGKDAGQADRRAPYYGLIIVSHREKPERNRRWIGFILTGGDKAIWIELFAPDVGWDRRGSEGIRVCRASPLIDSLGRACGTAIYLYRAPALSGSARGKDHSLPGYSINLQPLSGLVPIRKQNRDRIFIHRLRGRRSVFVEPREKFHLLWQVRARPPAGRVKNAPRGTSCFAASSPRPGVDAVAGDISACHLPGYSRFAHYRSRRCCPRCAEHWSECIAFFFCGRAFQTNRGELQMKLARITTFILRCQGPTARRRSSTGLDPARPAGG